MIYSRWLFQTLKVTIDVSFVTFWPLIPVAYCIHLHQEAPHLPQVTVSETHLTGLPCGLPSSKPLCLPALSLWLARLSTPLHQTRILPPSRLHMLPTNPVLRPCESPLCALPRLHNQHQPFPDPPCPLTPLYLCKCCLPARWVLLTPVRPGHSLPNLVIGHLPREAYFEPSKEWTPSFESRHPLVRASTIAFIIITAVVYGYDSFLWNPYFFEDKSHFPSISIAPGFNPVKDTNRFTRVAYYVWENSIMEVKS